MGTGEDELVVGLQRIDEVEEDENAVVVDVGNAEVPTEAPTTSTDAADNAEKRLKNNKDILDSYFQKLGKKAQKPCSRNQTN